MTTHFNHANLLKRLNKLGAKVTQQRNHFDAELNQKHICWYLQDENTAVCLHTPSPHTDVMTDYFADTHWHQLKAAFKYLTA